MDTNIPTDGSTRAGTLGGTAFVLWLQLPAAEIMKTIILAAIGATVSFAVSLLLRHFVRYRKKH
jgi:hypothetical protein